MLEVLNGFHFHFQGSGAANGKVDSRASKDSNNDYNLTNSTSYRLQASRHLLGPGLQLLPITFNLFTPGTSWLSLMSTHYKHSNKLLTLRSS